jgi:cytochrome c-type biogenesis protein CcmF
MLAEVGTVLVGLALAVALYAAYAVYLGIGRSDPRWALSGRYGVFATAGLLGLALLTLLAAFLSDQFQIEYVAQHSSATLPLYLKVSSVWGGQAGSLLLWAFLQALFAALVVVRPSDRTRALVPWTTVFLCLVTAFFTGVTLFLSNPFAQAAVRPPDGQGLNPLLRHPGMIFHPPALYLGYVGLAVPFAFALAALVTRRIDDWPTAARRWTLAAWLFLGLGVLLGARWAYDVLGWGGYWGWDPVENAGLLPWFTVTALLHGVVMQEQRRSFKVWNLLLAVFSFTLVLFGTFTTRSGLIQSVHAFARSNLGLYFLAAIGLTLVGSVALILHRRSILTDSAPVEALLSRDGMFYLTLILFLTLTASVLVGSVLPTITEVLTDHRFEAGPEWFDRVTGPQFAALVLVMGVCPLLGRAVAASRQLGSRGLPGLVGAILLPVIGLVMGFDQWVSIVGFAVIGLAGGTTIAEYVRDVLARMRRHKEENLFQALLSLLARNRRKYGGYLVHTGVILLALGVIGTRLYAFDTDVVLVPGEPVTVDDYVLVFEDLRSEPGDDHLSTWASLSVYRDGEYLTALEPRLDQYVNFEQTVALPALHTSLREDLYLVLAGWGQDGAMVTLKVFINPLAIFLWLGGIVVLAGGTVAIWPAARAARVSALQTRRQALGTSVGLVVGVLVLAAAGVAMWGTGWGAEARPEGRPLSGQLAPTFSLGLLDGSRLESSDLRGQVVLVNFWATWCSPCEDEMPDLQAVWDEYQENGIAFVGIAVDDEKAAVEEMVSRFGVTYPQGLDTIDGISAAYGITGVPETFILDSQGNVAYVHIGPVTAEDLRGELDALLGR